MRFLGRLACALLINALVLSVAYDAVFDDTSFRTDNGDLITKGMSKAEVTARFRRPDEKDVITHGLDCQVKIEIWNYYLRDLLVIITFAGNEASNIKVVRLR